MQAVSPRPGCGLRVVLVLVGGFIVHLSLGSFFTFGNFSPYIISYMRNRTHEVRLRNVDGLWVTSIGAIGNFIGLTGGGILDKRFGPRVASGAGGAIFSSAVMLTSLTVTKSFIWVVVTYGFMFACGMMMAYGPPVQTAIKWIPNRPSLAAGLIVSGFGGGSLIFNLVITAYSNPDNLTPDLVTEDGERYFTDSDLLERVPMCFLILGACYLGMQIIGIAMLTTPPVKKIDVRVDNDTKNGVVNEGYHKRDENSVQLYDVDSKEPNNVVFLKEKPTHDTSEKNDIRTEKVYKQKEKPTKTGEYTIKEAIIEMFRCRSFYILWLTILCMDAALQYCNGLYKAYGQTFIDDDHFLALVFPFHRYLTRLEDHSGGY